MEEFDTKLALSTNLGCAQRQFWRLFLALKEKIGRLFLMRGELCIWLCVPQNKSLSWFLILLPLEVSRAGIHQEQCLHSTGLSLGFIWPLSPLQFPHWKGPEHSGQHHLYKVKHFLLGYFKHVPTGNAIGMAGLQRFCCCAFSCLYLYAEAHAGVASHSFPVYQLLISNPQVQLRDWR